MSLSRNWLSDCKSINDRCCEVCHPWDKSCCSTTAGVFLIMFPRCVRVYFPLFLASDLAKYGFDMKRFILHTVSNTIRSATFLSFQGTALFPFSCLLRRLLGCYYMYTPVFIPILCSSFLGILMERKARRPPLSSYMCMEAIYGLFYSLKSKGFVKSLPNGEVVLFSFALSLLCQAMEHKENDLSISVLRFLLNPYFPIVNGSIVKHLRHTTMLRYYPKTAFLLSAAETCGWSFLIGYCGRSLSSMLTAVMKGKNYVHLIKPWLHRNNVQFGYFLAALTGIYKVSLAMFKEFLSLSKASLLAGALAGLSILLYKSPFTALYVAIKAIEILYRKIVKAGYLPSIRHTDALMYALGTATTIHLSVFEPDHVSKQYWTFLNNITRRRITDFNSQKLLGLGVKLSKRHTKADNELEDQLQQHRT